MEPFFAFLGNFWESLLPVCIVDPYEKAILLRMGTPVNDRRAKDGVLNPGWYWIWPFIERAILETVVENSETGPMQRLTTRDGKTVVVTPLVVFSIRDIRRFVLECEGRDGFLKDGLSATVSAYVRASNWEDLAKEENLKKLATATRRRSSRYGVEVHTVEFRDLVQVKALALVQP